MENPSLHSNHLPTVNRWGIGDSSNICDKRVVNCNQICLTAKLKLPPEIALKNQK